MSSSGENVIRIPIEVQLDKLEELKKAKDQLVQVKNDLHGTGKGSDKDFEKSLALANEQTVEEVLEKQTINPNSKFYSSFQKIFNNITNAAGTGTDAMMSAVNWQNKLVSVLKNAPVIGVIVSAIFASKEFGEYLFKWLTDYGRPWDLHFRRVLKTEMDLYRSREDRQKIRVGATQLIFTRMSGTSTPQYAFNTYQAVRNHEIYKMDIYRIRSGYRF